jgi:tetratricopeptide (TPR) repeat protein
MAKKNKAEEIVEAIPVETEKPYIEDSEKVKNLWAKYGKPFMTGFVVALVLGGGYLLYQNFVKAPKANEAAVAVFPVESYFDKMATSGFTMDSAKLALDGGVIDSIKVEGLLNIISKHGGTAAGNRANYMAGACYLHRKEFDKAIKYLNDFSANGAYQIDIKRHMMLGHANAELKKTDAALEEYNKAASINTKDEPFTSDALFTAASYAESVGKTKEAIEAYQKLKDNYPASEVVKGGDVDKYLAKLGNTK